MSTVALKIKQLKSLWAFFLNTLRFGFMRASPNEILYRRYMCITCPNVSATGKGEPRCSPERGCGCKVEHRIKPTASYCPMVPPRWVAVKRDFFFSEWLRK